MLGDIGKRLGFVRNRIRDDRPEDFVAFLATAIVLAYALGDEDLAEELGQRRVEMTPDFLDEVEAQLHDPDYPKDTPYDKYVEWIFRELRDHPQYFNAMKEFLRSVPEWQTATKTDILKLSTPEVHKRIDAWYASEAAKNVAYRFANGWYVQKLTRRKELEDEGEELDHCVGGGDYYKRVRAGDAIIYSLRDPKGRAHVTMEWLTKDRRFEQMMMADDAHPPSEKYRPMLVEFVTQVHGGNLRDLLLTGAKARDLDLRGADLYGADLTGAVLSGANLAGALLIRANLARANLTSANLTSANLTNAVLTRAVLPGANLAGADLTRAILPDVDLTDAVLADAVLADAILPRAKLLDADLRGAKLIDADLRDADLPRAKLLDADLRGAKLIDADLRGADLSGADLSGADLRGADLIRAVLTDAKLPGAKLRGANLTDATLRGTSLYEADLRGASLHEADLSSADLTNAIFDEETIMPDGTHWSPPAGLGYYRRRR